MGDDLERRVRELERRLEALRHELESERRRAERRRRREFWARIGLILVIALAYVLYFRAIQLSP